jgi:hypothetical protein
MEPSTGSGPTHPSAQPTRCSRVILVGAFQSVMHSSSPNRARSHLTVHASSNVTDHLPREGDEEQKQRAPPSKGVEIDDGDLDDGTEGGGGRVWRKGRRHSFLFQRNTASIITD